MHNSREIVSSRDIYVCAIGYLLNDLTEIDQIGRIENGPRVAADDSRRNGRSNTRDRNPWVVQAKYGVVARNSHHFVLVLCEPIDTEFFAVIECQLSNNRAERHL